MTDIPHLKTLANRRSFLGHAALLAAPPAAAALLGATAIPASAAPASPASAGDLSSFAPVPPSAFGPPLGTSSARSRTTCTG